MSEPLLSVCLITYNHAKYIKKAIDSVLMQKVDFSWELIIADDFSTDGTREIVLEYKQKYPEFIKLILQEKNVGAAQNFMDLMSAPSSKYIAYFEGDDYWIDPYKLQKQVGFLERNSEYSLCYHRVENIDYPSQASFTFSDSLKGMHGATLSMVFRNSNDLIKLFELTTSKTINGDWPLECLVLLNGNGYFMDQTMGVWNQLLTGASNTYYKGKGTESRLAFFPDLLKHAPLTPAQYQQVKNLLILYQILHRNKELYQSFSLTVFLKQLTSYVVNFRLLNYYDKEDSLSYKRQFWRTIKMFRRQVSYRLAKPH